MTTAETAIASRGQYRTVVQNDELASDALVRAVAAVEGCDPLDLDPLYGAIDPDTVDALFDPTVARGQAARTLTVTYHGHDVTLSDGSGATRVVVGSP